MNAEIYFPREGKSFAQTSSKAFENAIKNLNDIDVNIIYKTEVNLNEKSLTDALKVTDSGDEKIGLIIIADGIKEDSQEKAEGFFAGIGVIEKVKRIEPVSLSEEENSADKNNVSKNSSAKKLTKEEKQIEKLHKRQEKKLEKLRKKQDKALSNSIIKIAENDTISIETVNIKEEKEEKSSFAYFAEHNGKIIILLPEVQVTGTDFNTLLYSMVDTVVNPKKKNSFWKRFIPCSGDRPVDVVRKTVLMLAICTFIVSSYMLVDILFVEPAISDNTNSGIKDLIVSTDENGGGTGSSSSESSKTEDGILTDFSKLLEVNSDTIGWITIPNTPIDYVVVKPLEDKDPEYYLYRDFYGNDSKYGTVFMDYRSTLESKNIILHGHHMQDGRMFAGLTNFTDLDFYKSNPTFTFNTIYNKDKWKIISVFKTNTLEEQGEFFNYLRGDFTTDYDFLNFIYELKVRSIIDCPVDINENDTIVTLSTCAYDFDDYRLVVVARKIRDGEDSNVDISSASYNPNPLYPDIYYKTYGGTAPEVTTFQDAYNNGEITWYDGDKTDWFSEDDNLLARELKEAKSKSLKKLEEYVSEQDYAEAEKEKVDKLVEDYTKKINSAKDIDELNSVYDTALKEIKKVKTAEQLASEQSEKEESERQANEIKNTRSAAIVEIKNSIAGNTYRTAQADEVNSMIADYSDKINQETDLSKIEEYKQEAIDALSQVKTDNELRAEESAADEISRLEEERKKQLADAKSSAVSELENYVSLSNYYSEQQNEINSIISQYRENINGSDSVDSVNSALAEAKGMLDGVKTAADIDAETSSEPEPSVEQPSEVSEYSEVSEVSEISEELIESETVQ